ncbi:MAG: YdiU family protein [Bdellovibrionales bacterium]|nr:YdiU family protein [Bdellovibrionales bacterium]
MKTSFASTLSEAHFSRVKPTAVKKAELVAWSPEAAALIDWKPTPEIIQVLGGNHLLIEMDPIATRYGGHQFGHWAGQLGDGRAILVGEKSGYEIQLKGAGQTPYSRRGDGRAVLRSSLREYLCSEAMFFLNVPTTRALALVTTGEQVLRDMFYDGNPQLEPGAICTRLAPTFLRFGHFEIHAFHGDLTELKKLTDYALRFYPGHTIETFFRELCKRTAQLMLEWLRVGFVHGVMNTDNMSVLGLTIDYGPYGWLDVYDPDWTPNTTDSESRRYRFGQQPSIALWNLERLCEALSLLGKDLSENLEVFRSAFISGWERMMTQKLGLQQFQTTLVQELDQLLRLSEADMTLFYRALADILEGGALPDVFYSELTPELKVRWEGWLNLWRKNLKAIPLNALKAEMNLVNPAFILRNYLAQEATDALMIGDRSKLDLLERAIRRPYEIVDPNLCKKRPDWAKSRAGCSMLSCSS